MPRQKILFFIALFLLGGTFFLLWNDYENPRCIEDIITSQVSGRSLEGVVTEGSRVEILKGFYHCNKLHREDLIVYQTEDGRDPLIKIVKGISGDRFFLEKVGESWRIRINGKFLRTSQGEPYQFRGSKAEILLKEQERSDGLIPSGYALIFGNIAQGSVDSSRFGLIPLGKIIGKAICSECF